jgi:hypothetical protein
MNIYYTDKTIDDWFKSIPKDWCDEPQEQKCLHEQCPECRGTGIKKSGLGMCIHAISCPCRKCTPCC